MMNIAEFFKFKELNTDLKTEITAGVTTFATLAYIMIVNPMILSGAGIPFDAALASTVYMGFIGSVMMGLIANRPFGVAPLLAENAFLVSAVVIQFGFTWQQAFGAVFISALILFLLTIFNIRAWLVNSLPACMKFAFTAGLGLFLTFIGLKGSGIIVITDNAVKIGDFGSLNVLLAIFGFVLIIFLTVKKFKMAMLTALAAVTVLSVFFGQTAIPESLISAPPSLAPLFLKADVAGVLNVQSMPIIFIFIVLMFVDTMGSTIGVSERAGFLDENGNLPNIKKAMISDSAATVIGTSMSAITTGVYLESATGVEAGGRSGLTAVTIGCLFLSGLFLSPVFAMIPASACNSVLIVIGILMLSAVKKIDFSDMSEAAPSAVTIFLMAFSSNIGVAVASGFILYPILKLAAGKKEQLNPAVWILFAVSCVFFAIYKF